MKSLIQYINESKVPSYDNPVCIDCKGKDDADVSVEIGYSDYASSLFYVGDCGTDGNAALEAVVKYLVNKKLIDHYVGDEEQVNEYPDDFIEVEGYFLPSDKVVINTLVDNHGGRRK